MLFVIYYNFNIFIKTFKGLFLIYFKKNIKFKLETGNVSSVWQELSYSFL